MTAGYQALRDGAAWIDFDNRGRFRARGEDRARLLHAMTTNHILEMKPGDVRYVFFLNAQGRIQGDANVVCREDYFLLDTEPERHEVLFQHLDKFIIADDVALEDARADTSVIGVEGPESEALLARLGLSGAPISATGAPGVRLFVPPEEKAAIVARLGVPQATADDVKVVRLEHGRARFGEDITERNLVHETGQLHAVHFSKGCYLGQEIVERVRSRGQVHRVLRSLLIRATEPPPPGTPILAGDAAAGELTSAAYSPSWVAVAALGYIRAEFADQALTAGGHEVEVRR